MRQIEVDGTMVTIDHNGKDDDGNPVVFLMIENEDGEINLDLTRADVDRFIELLKELRDA